MRSFILLALIVPQVSFAWSPSQVSSLVDNRQRGISSTSLSAGENDATIMSSRRSFIQASLSAAAVLVSKSEPSYAADDELIDVYFGCGCFWHVQQ